MAADFLIYLASPYSHKSLTIRRQRARAITHVAAVLHVQGYHVFSPIVHGHAIWEEIPLKRLAPSYQRYIDWGLDMIERSNQLWVVMLEGWRVSTGIQVEVGHARRLDIPVLYFDPTKILRWEEGVANAITDQPPKEQV